jgi:hypothetical protein
VPPVDRKRYCALRDKVADVFRHDELADVHATELSESFIFFG